MARGRGGRGKGQNRGRGNNSMRQNPFVENDAGIEIQDEFLNEMTNSDEDEVVELFNENDDDANNVRESNGEPQGLVRKRGRKPSKPGETENSASNNGVIGRESDLAPHAPRIGQKRGRKRPREVENSDSNNGVINRAQLDARLDRLMSSEGRLNEETRKRRKAVLDDFKQRVIESGENFDDLIKEKEDLERFMVNFLDDYKVLDKDSGKVIKPKDNTLNSIRSHLKCALSDLTGYNFGDKVAFAGLANATATIRKEIKQSGRGETTHHPPIPDETQDAIFQLAANVYEVMEARYEMDYQRYYDTLKNIPEIFRDSYHILISLLAQFIVTFFDGRRGAEGIELLTKSHWKLQEENGKRILKKALGEVSKNWQRGSENLEASGIITDFTLPKSGFNALKFYLMYLEHLNPKCDRLFQKGRQKSSKFDIHNFGTIVWYENSPQGKHKIAKMLELLTSAVGKPRLTNHSIRTTTIQTLIRLGFNSHEVMQFTGHKSAESLKNYDPVASVEQRQERAIALQTRFRPALNERGIVPPVNPRSENQSGQDPGTIPADNVPSVNLQLENNTVEDNGNVQAAQNQPSENVSGNKKPNYTCPFGCDGGFETKQETMEHMDNVHGNYSRFKGKGGAGKGKGTKRVREEPPRRVLAEIDTNSHGNVQPSTSTGVQERAGTSTDFEISGISDESTDSILQNLNDSNFNFDEEKSEKSSDKENSFPCLTQGNNSNIDDFESMFLRSEQQMSYAWLEMQRQRMQMFHDQKRRKSD